MNARKILSLVSVLLLLFGASASAAEPEVFATLAAFEEATGESIVTFNEAPSLAERVAQGELPPVEERISSEPLVLRPADAVGRYGGSLETIAVTATSNAADAVNIVEYGQQLVTMTHDLEGLTPNLAKAWDMSDDLTVLTVELRAGVRWSDGAPFTTDDVMFWYEDIILNAELTPVVPVNWAPGGETVHVEKIDDYTVSFEFAVPHPTIVSAMGLPAAPRHFLEEYHIDYNPGADDLAGERGFDEWWQLFNYYYQIETNQVRRIEDYPALSAWVLTEVAQTYYVYERNPFFWKIDSEGNQLPYIDEVIRTTVENDEVYMLKVMSGEADIAAFSLQLQGYPVLRRNEESGGYRTMLWGSIFGSDLYLVPNYTHKDEVLREIFNDLRFRQALSLAIDRDEINEILYFGQAIPRQATALPITSFYEDWMGEHYAQFDLDRANELLDDMGLAWNSDGTYRLRPDGRPLSVSIDYVLLEGPKDRLTELVAEYWGNVGVLATPQSLERSLYQQRGLANEGDFRTWHLDWSSDASMHRLPHRYRPPWHNPLVVAGGKPWWDWYESQGTHGEEPPEVIQHLFEVVDQWQQTGRGTEEYERLGREILTVNVENLFKIGTVGLSPKPVVKTLRLANMADEGIFGSDTAFFGPYLPEQWYFTD